MQLARVPAEKHGQVAILGRSLPLQLDNVANILKFGFGRTVTFTAKTAENKSSFLFPPDFDEPARGFGHGPNDDEEEDKGHDLESDGEAPDERRVYLPVKGSAVFNPVSDNDTEDVEGEFDGDKLAAGCVAGGFSGPDGGDGVKNACSDSVQNTGAEHPLGILSRTLESGADDSPYGGDRDGLDTAISIAKPSAEEGAKEGAWQVVDCDLRSRTSDKG